MHCWKRKVPHGPELFGEGVPKLKHSRVFEHRARMEAQLVQADALVTTSRAAKEMLVERLNKLARSQFTVIEHGRSLNRYNFARTPRDGERIRFVAFGALGFSKGASLFEFLLKRNMRAGRRFEFHFLGSGLGESAALRKLGGMTHGRYSRSELPEKIRQIGPALSMILSTVPETYCHTLTEAWAMGLPVVASDIGALRERILKHGGGWLVDYRNPEGIWNKLIEIIQDRKSFSDVCDSIDKIKIRSEGEMAQDYSALYESLKATN
jgi:glycosyltransferase involved in cell wall biosynthesis